MIFNSIWFKPIFFLSLIPPPSIIKVITVYKRTLYTRMPLLAVAVPTNIYSTTTMFPWTRKPSCPVKLNSAASRRSGEEDEVSLAVNSIINLLPSADSTLLSDIPLPPSSPTGLHSTNLPTVASSSPQPPTDQDVEKPQPVTNPSLLPPTDQLNITNSEPASRPPTTNSEPASRSPSPSAFSLFTTLLTGMVTAAPLLSPLPKTSRSSSPMSLVKDSYPPEATLSSRSSSPTVLDLTPPLINKRQRKSLKLNRKQCTYIYRKGTKKNTQCTKLSKTNGTSLLCSQHDCKPKTTTNRPVTENVKVQLPKTITSRPVTENRKIPITSTITNPIPAIPKSETLSTTLKPTRLRINRLHTGQKYYFVKHSINHSVLVRYRGKLCKLRLPRQMELPTTTGYFIRRKQNPTDRHPLTTFVKM